MESEFFTTQLGQMIAVGYEVLPEMTSAESTETSQAAEVSLDDASSVSESEVERDDPIYLSPGVYCGGLRIGDKADVILEPGIYVMKDGPLWVGGSARITGEHVGFYFTGDDATLYFGSKTSISLSAPADGQLAGILFFEDRSAREGRLYSILSDDARVLTGTIYLPRATFVVDADRPIADQSAYTAIIANRLTLFAGPHLVLNTDYDTTDVPVPANIQHNNSVMLVN